MSNPTFLSSEDILSTLRELNANVTLPLWLSGGVAVDFLVGRWTRPHGDIDFNTLANLRDDLTQELGRIGYTTSDPGWLTQWFQDPRGQRLEIAFLEQIADGTAVLEIRDGDPVGVPGTYPLLPDYLDLNRFAILEGVKFRVCSPAGEWLARANGIDVVGGRTREPKIEHDLQLLESMIPEAELARLRSTFGGTD